jgi:hypothetical protein
MSMSGDDFRGSKASRQWRPNLDIDIVGELSMAANRLEELEKSGTVDRDVLTVLKHLQAAVRDLAIYSGIDYD